MLHSSQRFGVRLLAVPLIRVRPQYDDSFFYQVAFREKNGLKL